MAVRKTAGTWRPHRLSGQCSARYRVYYAVHIDSNMDERSQEGQQEEYGSHADTLRTVLPMDVSGTYACVTWKIDGPRHLASGGISLRR